ncbi:nickel transporter permease [Halalkalibacter nanhaiisediminis]|uniref:Peptide/nickel transport system permease protein n=1 Tax=Halalkalibacter nanhaiisediminis TaxID=688079 RepID=A0A562QBK0_9BACI|nr:nickel transporter permease [Halalkalibacter nanhaiisediminis]TWI54104.1 peptide/nickel transport system permease protein [Halalkalibacter nanhaiisediminis]
MTLKWLFRDRMLAIGISIFALIVIAMLIGPFFVPNDPLEMSMSQRLQSPSFEYPLGTDFFGRCIFSRLIEGAKITFGLAAIVLVAALCIGVPVGLLSGYIGGRVDAIFMRLVDGLIAFPDFILAIAIAGFLGPNLTNVIIAIVVVKWVSYARVVRSCVLAEKEKDYVVAARLNGSSTSKIIVKHLTPHVISQIAILASLDLGKIILIISSLSYLGIGAQPPTPEWGAMLNDARPYFQTMPSLMLYPGLAIMLVVLSCNLIGDGLRESFDIKK